MATLHLMVGLPCSGKTTYARRLEAAENALRLTPDAWQRRLFGSSYHPGEEADTLHDNIESIMWDIAARVLPLGVSVILDFGFWSLAERDFFRMRAAKLGAACKVHYMDVSQEELFRRLALRNAAQEDESLVIPPAYLVQWCGLFEPPSAEELAL